jgi:hypothetical protein
MKCPDKLSFIFEKAKKGLPSCFHKEFSWGFFAWLSKKEKKKNVVI